MARPNSHGKIRIGILGAGIVAESYHLPVLQSLPSTRVEWICDQVKEVAVRLAKAYDSCALTVLDDAPDVDIVLVAIPMGVRREPLHAIFRRHWHVLCEKPFASSLEEHERLLREAATNNTHVGVALMRRYYGTMVLLRRLVESRVFGAIKDVWASEAIRMRGTGRQEGWYLSDPTAGGGILYETGSHLIDQIFYALGVREATVEACRQVTYKDVDFESRVLGTLRTEHDEIRLTTLISILNDGFSGIVIRFEDVTLRMGLQPGEALVLETRDGRALAQLSPNEGALEVFQAFHLEWQDFINQCTTGSPAAIDAGSVTLSTAFIESCYRKAEREETGAVEEG